MHKLVLGLVVAMCVVAYCSAGLPSNPTLPTRPQKRLLAYNWRLCWGGSCWMCLSLRNYCVQHDEFCLEFVQLCTAYAYFYGPLVKYPSGRKGRKPNEGATAPKLNTNMAKEFSRTNLAKA